MRQPSNQEAEGEDGGNIRTIRTNNKPLISDHAQTFLWRVVFSNRWFEIISFRKKPSLSSLSRRYHIEQWKKLQHHQHKQYAEAIGDAHIQWS